MLTDSADWEKTHSLQVLRKIMESEQQLPEEERLTLHMIGFGVDVDTAFITALADIGNGSYLVCQTGSDMDRLDLVKAFSQLAAQPALKVSLLQILRGGTSAVAASQSGYASIPHTARYVHIAVHHGRAMLKLQTLIDAIGLSTSSLAP
jgi:putative aminopeptidase FrvX